MLCKCLAFDVKLIMHTVNSIQMANKIRTWNNMDKNEKKREFGLLHVHLQCTFTINKTNIQSVAVVLCISFLSCDLIVVCYLEDQWILFWFFFELIYHFNCGFKHIGIFNKGQQNSFRPMYVLKIQIQIPPWCNNIFEGRYHARIYVFLFL